MLIACRGRAGFDASLPLPGRTPDVDHAGWLNQTAAIREPSHLISLGPAAKLLVERYLEDVDRGFTGFEETDFAALERAVPAPRLRLEWGESWPRL